jgi:hypothetical protein
LIATSGRGLGRIILFSHVIFSFRWLGQAFGGVTAPSGAALRALNWMGISRGPLENIGEVSGGVGVLGFEHGSIVARCSLSVYKNRSGFRIFLGHFLIPFRA